MPATAANAHIDDQADSQEGPRATSQDAAPSRLAELLRASADPARLGILRLLERDAFAVGELSNVLGLGQATISHHLKALSEAGLLTARRDGTHTFYRRALPTPGEGAALHEALLTELDARPLPDSHRAAREAVYETRAARSREFFERHGDRFDAARDLIAEPDAYLPELAELLPESIDRCLELGPGPGEFLPTLAARAKRVVALDASSTMLERARARCAEAGIENVDFVEGDFGATTSVLGDGRQDVIVCAMVLHHVPRPEAIVSACAAALAPGGALLVADLCPHGQDWTRDACGDVWPGIDPDALRSWAEQSGLRRGPSQFLARRNGFRIQLQRFERPAMNHDASSAADVAADAV